MFETKYTDKYYTLLKLVYEYKIVLESSMFVILCKICKSNTRVVINVNVSSKIPPAIQV
jgi:hypothetical protein